MDELNSVRLYCRTDDIRWKTFFCLAGAVFNIVMICVHEYKRIFMNAYIPHKIFSFYFGAFLVFLILTILFILISMLKLCEEYFIYRGKKYDQKDYSYSLLGSKLVLYKNVSMSIIPEYIKEIEVEVAGNKREEVLAFLELYYTEKPEWADVMKTEDGLSSMSLIMKAADVVCGAGIIVLLIVFSYRGYIVNEWEMIAADDGIEITAYNGNKTDIIIPSKVDGLDIVGIKDFSNTSVRKKEKVNSVDIPDTVKRISGNSFNDYHYLEQITFTTSVSSVSGSSFHGCPSLSTFVIHGTQKTKDLSRLAINFYIPTMLIFKDCNIPDKAFENCDMIESVTIRGNMISIGAAAFKKCYGLRKVSVFGDVESIGDNAFYDCRYLMSIDLPDGLKSIGDSAFEGCMCLTSVQIPDSLESIGSSVFSGSGLTRLTIPVNAIEELSTLGNSFNLEEVTLLGSTDTLDEAVFKGCRNLKSVVLPEGMKIIGDSAFLACSTLKNVVLPVGLKNIGDHAFRGCSSLKSIDLPDGVESIGESAFEMSGLTAVTVPEGCTEIAANAFSDCADLQYVDLPDSLETLGEAAFHNSPVHSVFLPDNLTQFDEKAFLDKIHGNHIFLCYTPDCEAKDQIEAAYDGMRDSRQYYSLLTVANRKEYEKRYDSDNFFKQNEEFGKEDVIGAYDLETEIFVFDNRITGWKGYYAEEGRLVPVDTAGVTMKMTLYGDGTGVIFVSTDHPAYVSTRSFTLEAEDEYSMIMTFDETEEIYETDPYKVQIYEDPEGDLYLWIDTGVEEIWFLKEE